MAPPHISLAATVLSAPDAGELALFYQQLLGWEVTHSEARWVMLSPGAGLSGLSFQSEDDYVPPVWPATGGEQQMMSHLDLVVDDLDAATAHAVDLGATVADFQPQQGVRVCLDPAGHPFCLFIDGA